MITPRMLALLLGVAGVHGITIPPANLKVEVESDAAAEYDMESEQGLLDTSLIDVKKPFNLETLLEQRHEGSCNKSAPIHYPGQEVVALTIARTGSESLKNMMLSAGMKHTFHDHDCTMAHVRARGAKKVVVTLRHPIARIISGFGRRMNTALKTTKEANLIMSKHFPVLNDFIDALRDPDHQLHEVALKSVYGPKRQSYFMPVSEFYLGGFTGKQPKTNQLKFVCTCRLGRDVHQISMELKWEVQPVLVQTHKTHLKSDFATTRDKLLSKENVDFLENVYAKDIALYKAFCGARCPPELMH